MRYVGLDVHAKNFSVAVVDDTETVLFEHTFPTSAENLIAVSWRRPPWLPGPIALCCRTLSR